VNSYLIVFDRAHGRISHFEEFDDRATALHARFAAERRHMGDPNVEVVVLGADSVADLHRTHARYFKTLGELAEEMADKIASRT
jgi:hypothetical protein